MFASTFTTTYGTGMVLATDQGICRVILPSTDNSALTDYHCLSPSILTTHAAEQLHHYYAGQGYSFEDITVDLSGVTPFRARVLELIRAIPRAETRSYGQVAAMIGAPHAARAVGGAMAANPVPIIIPCHRVVASNGTLTGFSAPGGLTTKKSLLEAEGVDFSGEIVCQKKKVLHS